MALLTDGNAVRVQIAGAWEPFPAVVFGFIKAANKMSFKNILHFYPIHVKVKPIHTSMYLLPPAASTAQEVSYDVRII